MKKILLILSSLLLFATAAQAQQYAELSKLERKGNVWTVQADYVDLVTPNVAVARGAIPASDARHYKAVFSNQSTQKREFTVSENATVSLMTFPDLIQKNAKFKDFRAMLEGSDDLPSEFVIGSLFVIKLSGKQIVSLGQVNTRAITGVYEQVGFISRKSTFSAAKLVLDFAYLYTTERELRRDGTNFDLDPSGLYISNKNPELRSFTFAKNARVRLLKDSSDYATYGLSQLEEGLNGKDFGWPFGWETYFYATISVVTGEILEIKQGYVP
jgi:hypothetical protein